MEWLVLGGIALLAATHPKETRKCVDNLKQQADRRADKIYNKTNATSEEIEWADKWTDLRQKDLQRQQEREERQRAIEESRRNRY